jgi:hypothetical protein
LQGVVEVAVDDILAAVAVQGVIVHRFLENLLEAAARLRRRFKFLLVFHTP